jgi:hypothetical protein
LGFCEVGTIGWSAGDECVGGTVNRLGKDVRGRWMRRDRKNNWEGEQWIVAQEKEGA